MNLGTKQNVLMGARLFFGLLTLAAIATQLVIQIQRGLSVVNFFSFFTILSNLFAAVVMIIGTAFLMRHRQQRWMTSFEGPQLFVWRWLVLLHCLTPGH
jgi:carbon starvation protein CstA